MSAYTREQVEALLPAVFDRQFAWGMRTETEAPADMPKTKTAKNESHTLWALLADARSCWKRAPLDLGQRRAMVLVGGIGMTYREAGEYLAVNRSTVMRRYEAGVSILLHCMNGTCAEGDEGQVDEDLLTAA